MTMATIIDDMFILKITFTMYVVLLLYNIKEQ